LGSWELKEEISRKMYVLQGQAKARSGSSILATYIGQKMMIEHWGFNL
jgi:hypothetical protein